MAKRLYFTARVIPDWLQYVTFQKHSFSTTAADKAHEEGNQEKEK